MAERKLPRISRVPVESITNKPDPKSLETFIREKDEQDRLEADLLVFFKEILAEDELNVVKFKEGLFGEGKKSLAEIKEELSMTDKEIVMLLQTAWRKIRGHSDKLKQHLNDVRKRA